MSAAASSTITDTTAASSPLSPQTSTRSSRLRGLSYLRNVHFLSRDHSPSSSSAAAAGPSLPSSSSSRSFRPAVGLARSASYSPSTSRDSHLADTESTNATNQSLLSPANEGSSQVAAGAEKASTTPNTPQARGQQADPFLAAASVTGRNPPSTGDQAAVAADTSSSSRTESGTMARGRAASATAATGGSRESPSSNGGGEASLPSIRFSAYYDPRAPRPSLTFQPVTRTLPTGSEVIKVGRYSERDTQPTVPINAPSSAPVGFKSKVVSRRHCEFWFEHGKWYIRDVKSSSGTFLNHIRLSPPATESKPYPVNDGDIVQLGIDFKGGEEMIFRCVKMRLELNRGWQSKLNTFNMSTHKQLRSLAGPAGSSSQDCSICLNSIAPCQSLFVAPCSHTWHYKCIRSLIDSPSYPIFICPNCRAAADLEAEVDDASEEWEQLNADDDMAQEDPPTPARANDNETPSAPVGQLNGPLDTGDVTVRVDLLSATNTPQSLPTTRHAQSDPVPIRGGLPASATRNNVNRTPSPEGGLVTNGHEGPITPRNDAGPWVFDGSAGEESSPIHPTGSSANNGTGSGGGGIAVTAAAMRSIDAAALDAERRP